MNAHPSLGALLLAGGLLTSALAAQWRQLAPPLSPSPRMAPAMAADYAGNTFLFGGLTSFVSLFAENDTWRFDGSVWQQLAPTNPPGPRHGASLVFDTIRSVFVMFGGSPFVASVGGNETWEFDGVTWTQVVTAVMPNSVLNHGACYDSARQRVVVYGGMFDVFTLASSANLYEYDGANWQQIATTGGPGPLDGVSMCFHTGHGKAVLFGGRDYATGYGTDATWRYDGVAWTAVPVVGARPSARIGAGMVYDAARAVCVLTGGYSMSTGAMLSDTWEFDGTSWQQQNTSVVAASFTGLAFDLAHQNIVRFGGLTSIPLGPVGTWRYGAGVRTFGSGCPGSNGTPLLQATTAPNLGFTWHLQLSNLVPTIPIAALALGLAELPGLSLAGIGMPGCAAFVTPDVLVSLPASGSALWASSVPAAPSLLGVSLFAQGVSLDPTSNAAGLVVSNAVEGVLGH